MDTKMRLMMPLILGIGLILTILALLSTTAQAAQRLRSNALSINSVTPSYGWSDKDTWVYIEGSGFVDPLTVTLGTEPLNVKEVISDRILTIVPAELTPGLYNLTVETTNGLSATRYDAYRVLEPTDVDDLTSYSEWLWTEPRTLRIGYINSGVGLNVQRLGGSPQTGVLKSTAVEFVLRNETGDVVLSRSQIPFLAPAFVESTGKVIWEPEDPGRYTICAIIDPDNQLKETDENNNMVCRTVTVLDQVPDLTPPLVQNLSIEDGVVSTTEVAVTLDVTAADPPPNPRSGLDAIKFIEFEYNLAASRWLPVQQSEWVPYSLADEDYPWTLLQTYGTRYMRAWAVDKAGNISSEPARDVINLVPSEQVGYVAEDGVVFYRMLVEQGQTFTATLTPVSGDPDLYVWASNNEFWYSSNPTGIDSVAFEAPETGIYQIEVHGYTNAEYRLTFGTTDMPVKPSRRLEASDKPFPTAPTVRLDDLPGSDFYDLNPPLEPVSNFYIYLPLIR